MPDTTEYLKLEKPFETENYNINVFNQNADKLDAACATLQDGLETANAELGNKANQDSPALTGAATLNGKEIAVMESGTWTPTFSGATVAGTFEYESRAGRYVKIGKLVYIHAVLEASNQNSAAGGLSIRGLPFLSEALGCGEIAYFNIPDYNLTGKQVEPTVTGDAILLRTLGTGQMSVEVDSEKTGKGTYIEVSASYLTS